MKPRNLYLCLAVLLLGIVAYCTHLSSRIADLEHHARDQQNEAHLRDIEHALRAPEETFLHGGKLDRNIAELRLQYYAEHGITHTVPFNNVSRVNWDSIVDPDGRLTERWEVDATNLANGSTGHWWLNHGSRTLQGLASWLEEGRPDYGHMPSRDTGMRVIRTRIRPLVVRWLRAYHGRVRLDAIRVLLAMGDRSPELTEILHLTMRLGHIRAIELCNRYDIPIPEGSGDDSEEHDYTMEQLHRDWKRIRELTDVIEQDTHRDYLTRQERARAAAEAAMRGEQVPGI